MAELRIHDNSSQYFKSLRSRSAPVDVNLLLPNKSGLVITDTNILDILIGDADVLGYLIYKPNIKEKPLSNPNNFVGMLEIASYRTNATFVGVHQRTEWVAATDPGFNNIIDHTTAYNYLRHWLPTVSTTSSWVYVKYRFMSEGLVSPWSDAYKYKPGTNRIDKPTITYHSNNTYPSFTGSPIKIIGAINGISHTSTYWAIRKKGQTNNVYTFTTSGSELNRIDLWNKHSPLEWNTDYVIEMTYITNQSSNSPFKKSPTGIGMFKTPNSGIRRPTLTRKHDAHGDWVQSSSFTPYGVNDEHDKTEWVVRENNKVVYYTKNSQELTTLDIGRFFKSGVLLNVQCRYFGKTLGYSAYSSLNYRCPVVPVHSTENRIKILQATDGSGKFTITMYRDSIVLPGEVDLYSTFTIYCPYLDKRVEVILDDPQAHLSPTGWNTSSTPRVYTFGPGQKIGNIEVGILKWFRDIANRGGVPENQALSLSVKGKLVTNKRELNFRGREIPIVLDCNVGNIIITNGTSIRPTIKLSGVSGTDYTKWMGPLSTTWEIRKKSDNSVKYKETKPGLALTCDYKLPPYQEFENVTDYIIKVTVNTRVKQFSRSLEWKSPKAVINTPNVGLSINGLRITMTVSNFGFENYYGDDNALTEYYIKYNIPYKNTTDSGILTVRKVNGQWPTSATHSFSLPRSDNFTPSPIVIGPATVKYALRKNTDTHDSLPGTGQPIQSGTATFTTKYYAVNPIGSIAGDNAIRDSRMSKLTHTIVEGWWHNGVITQLVIGSDSYVNIPDHLKKIPVKHTRSYYYGGNTGLDGTTDTPSGQIKHYITESFEERFSAAQVKNNYTEIRNGTYTSSKNPNAKLIYTNPQQWYLRNWKNLGTTQNPNWQWVYKDATLYFKDSEKSLVNKYNGETAVHDKVYLEPNRDYSVFVEPSDYGWYGSNLITAESSDGPDSTSGMWYIYGISKTINKITPSDPSDPASYKVSLESLDPLDRLKNSVSLYKIGFAYDDNDNETQYVITDDSKYSYYQYSNFQGYGQYICSEYSHTYREDTTIGKRLKEDKILNRAVVLGLFDLRGVQSMGSDFVIFGGNGWKLSK